MAKTTDDPRPLLSSLQATQLMIPKVNQLASERLKDLLEKKHLYQKVSLDLSETIAAIRPRVHPSNANAFNTWLNDLQRQRLILSTGPLRVASRDGQKKSFRH